jgi:hypothetical protein
MERGNESTRCILDCIMLSLCACHCASTYSMRSIAYMRISKLTNPVPVHRPDFCNSAVLFSKPCQQTSVPNTTFQSAECQALGPLVDMSAEPPS